jgi:AcrR family transcriptional regulator
MARIREKQLQKRKQETLDVALRLLYERGYANLNMDELAEEVGISKPTLYQYFNSKDELVSQVIVRMFEKMEEQLSELSGKSPFDQLEHFLRLMLKSRAEKRHVMAQLDSEIRRSIIQRNPELREHLLTARSKLTRIVEKAQEAGDIDPALPAWVVVSMVFALQGIISNPYSKEELQRSDEEISEAIESIICLFRRGVGAETSEKSSIPHEVPAHL